MAELTNKESKRVTVAMGYTHQPKTFESIRLDYKVESPVLDGESTKKALERVEALIEEKLTTKLQELGVEFE